MKLRNLFFLSRANLKGAKRKKSVLVMMTLSVISVVLLAGFLNIYNSVLNTMKNNIEFRQILISPTLVTPNSTLYGVNESNIDKIRGIEHVESCDKQMYMEYQYTTINKIKDEKGNDITNSSEELSVDKINTGIDEQIVDSQSSVISVKGEQLKDAPVMSCIIPDYAYPMQEKRFDTSMLLGKTITVETEYQFDLYEKNEDGGYIQNRDITEPMTYELKVVGIYHYARESAYGGSAILISPETAQKIEDMAVSGALEGGIDLDDYVKDPYARNYIVTVDDEKNADEVSKKLIDMRLHTMGYLPVDPSMTTFVNFFTGAGTFLLGAILLLMVICLFLSVYTNINSRRSEIGLMKALGYKSSHIFIGMYIENVILSIRALIAGVAVSAVVSLIVNAINSSSERLLDHSYVMSFQVFGIMTLIAFAVILAVPLLCQLIMVKRLSNIRPQEAMNA